MSTKDTEQIDCLVNLLKFKLLGEEAVDLYEFKRLALACSEAKENINFQTLQALRTQIMKIGLEKILENKRRILNIKFKGQAK